MLYETRPFSRVVGVTFQPPVSWICWKSFDGAAPMRPYPVGNPEAPTHPAMMLYGFCHVNDELLYSYFEYQYESVACASLLDQ